MNITPIKTRLVGPDERDLFGYLDTAVKQLSEQSILVVTSKIISFFEGNLVSKEGVDKTALIQKEADYYLPPEKSRYHASLSIRESAFISSGGIDESNAAGRFVLLPKDSQRSAGRIRQYLKKRFNVKKVGVIITDSRSIPLRRGALGVTLAWSGFHALHDYRGETDLFGRPIQYEVANIADGLAVAAVTVMGEGREQTPLALITDIQDTVTFVDRGPTMRESAFFFVTPKDDLFAPLFNYQNLKKGKKKD